VHELSIVQALIDQVEQHARARSATAVRNVCVRVGSLSGVDVQLLETAYETFREHTICAGAPLVTTEVPAAWSCPRCDALIAPGAVLRCPSCDLPARLTAGDEIILDRIEMEVRDV
jgi:hydrogenase nickel incorporation protein HypA/HybF